MKLLFYLLLTVISFAGVFVGVLWATGNLQVETFERLWKTPEPAAASTPISDDTSELAQAIREEQERITKERARIEEEEARLQIAQRELDDTRRALEQLVTQLTGALDQNEANRKDALKEIADSLKEMDGKNAAQALQSWPPEEAARILAVIPARDRGGILDAMDAQQAGIILQRMAELPAS